MNKEALEALKANERQRKLFYKLSSEKYGSNCIGSTDHDLIEEFIKQYISTPNDTEVSKDTNVEEVQEALKELGTYYKTTSHLEMNGIEERYNRYAKNSKSFETIRNYITNVPKDVPNQSAKSIADIEIVDSVVNINKPKRCPHCNQMYDDSSQFKLKELQND